MPAANSGFPSANLLAGKAAVVTGGGGGIGRIVAQVFAREGAKVLVADISGKEKEVAEQIGAAATAYHIDLSQEDQVEDMFAAAVKTFGRLDASVHLAAVLGGRAAGDDISLAEFERMTSGPLRATLLCTKYAGRAMTPTGGGAIVNFSSLASFNADPQIAFGYSAAKAAVNSLTKSFAIEYGPANIRVNAIAPGWTLTEKNRGMPAEFFQTFVNKSPLGRGADPEEQAQLAAFLCSDRAAFLSGAIIPLDGGWAARLA
jgi:NAD(P)-dependent dehydrogenase (short-subunit alcohol dehydrogenase family)